MVKTNILTVLAAVAFNIVAWTDLEGTVVLYVLYVWGKFVNFNEFYNRSECIIHIIRIIRTVQYVWEKFANFPNKFCNGYERTEEQCLKVFRDSI